jgi:hypothetical protein
MIQKVSFHPFGNLIEFFTTWVDSCLRKTLGRLFHHAQILDYGRTMLGAKIPIIFVTEKGVCLLQD